MSYRSCTAIVICLCLAGCGGATYAPVSERSLGTQSAPKSNQYIVKKGDTLYAIAFRYGLDYRELARRNGIGADYGIYPGQQLSIKPVDSPAGSIVRDASITAPKPVITSSQAKQEPWISSRSTPPEKTVIVKKQTQSKVSSAPAPVKTTKPAVSKPKPQPKKEVKKPIVSKPVVPKSAPVKHVKSGPIRWQWPAPGRVIGSFKTKGKVNKGVNIAGSKGSAVKAAANGKVVYAGSGLLGYGNLVIIDHNQQFLSAYAHNSRILVKESDMVKVGQRIAEMGSSGADRVMLHFEIRRDGKPVNPLKYLPKR